MRIVFDKDKVKESVFFKFCKENGATYYDTGDEEYAVWIMEKQYGNYLLAVKLKPKGTFEIGNIIPDCNNFEKKLNVFFFIEEGVWLSQLFKIFEKLKIKEVRNEN